MTAENVRRLLRWKDPRMLSEEILSGPNQGQPNERITRVLDHLAGLNDFRYGRIDENTFRPMVESIYPSGLVWRVLLFHIARPYAFPLLDQHVFRAFSTMSYRDFFFRVAQAAGIIRDWPHGSEPDLRAIVSDLKKLDDALLVFGQLLKRYHRPLTQS